MALWPVRTVPTSRGKQTRTAGTAKSHCIPMARTQYEPDGKSDGVKSLAGGETLPEEFFDMCGCGR